MAEFGKFVISFMLVALLIFLIISWNIDFENENNFSVKLTDNGVINKSFSDLNTSLLSLKEKSEENKRTFLEGNPKESELGLNLKQAFVVSREISTGFLTNIFTVIYEMITKVLGLNPMIYVVFLSMFIITFLVLIYQWLRSGQ